MVKTILQGGPVQWGWIMHLAGFVHCQFDGKVVELNMIGGKFFAGGEAKQSNLGLDAGYLGLDAG